MAIFGIFNNLNIILFKNNEFYEIKNTFNIKTQRSYKSKL